ncbi:MAG: NAD(P)-dependent oxidoreductase [Saprospiraceae bacterium]
MKKLLVTGISGFLGWHIAKHLQGDFQLLGIYNKTKPDLKNIQFEQLDLINQSAVSIFLKKHQPDAILHLAANSNPNDCEQNPLSQIINVKVTEHLASYCAAQNIQFLFTSTDLIFDGKNAPYSLTDTPNPIMVYGKQKLEAEQRVWKVNPKAIIARMPLMYGLPKNGLGFMNAWLRNLQAGKNVYCFTDEYRTATFGGDAAQGVFALLKSKTNGIFHLGGPERMSRFEFATQMAEHFGLDKSLIIPSLQKDVNMPAKRPADVSLDSNKTFTFGFLPKKMTDNLEGLSTILK